MAHHYYCFVCGNHIDYFESFCYLREPENKEEIESFRKQSMGGFGDGCCNECLQDFFNDDLEEAYKNYNKEGNK